MKLRTKLIQAGKTATGFEIPAKIVEALGSSKRPKVSVTINNYTYRSSIAMMRGTYMLGVSAGVREKTGVNGGDIVDVDIELDEKPREVEVPKYFQKILDKNAKAKQIFDSLSYSHKLQHVLAIEGAKTPETRERRMNKALEMLSKNKNK